MKKSNEFENILDDCLERLARGETVEQCLESYPEQAAQLRPLLQTSQLAREASAILPRAGFKARARYEFRSALQAKASKTKLPLFSLRRGWVMVLMVVSILLVSGGGAALAASNSMPDSPLYPVKLATEQVQLALTPSDMGKARLSAMLADRRVTEIIYMVDKGDVQRVEVITQRLDERLATLAILVSAEKVEVPAVETAPRVPTEESAAAPLPSAPSDKPSPALAPAPVPAPAPSEEPEDDEGAFFEGNDQAELRMIVAHYAVENPDALRAVLRKAPASVRPALLRAIVVSEAGYRKTLAAMD